MTEKELIELLSGDFYENFAEQVAGRVCDADAAGALYALVTSSLSGLPKPVVRKIRFRGAYVLEKIYFGNRKLFTPRIAAFCRDFPACSDPGARRHFTKIMAHLLNEYMPDPATLERIADAAAQWAVDPASKVSVRVWAVEVLKCCRGRVAWVDGSWDDLLETLARDATPGIESRMRKSWKVAPREGGPLPE